MKSVDAVDERAVFSAAYGTEFVLLLRQRRASGEELSPNLLVSVAHDAMTAARAAVQGMRSLGELNSPTPRGRRSGA